MGWLQRLFSPQKTTLDAPSPATVVADAVAAEKPAPPPADEAPAPRPSTSNISWLQRSDANAAFTDWLFDGTGQRELFTSPLEKDILAAIEKIVQSKQSGADLVRRMPGVIPQLLQSLRTEDFSGTELARKISHDVVLVAAVIRIANSSVYNPGKPITSIEHAILVLGQAGLRQLITSVAFRPIIDLNSGAFTKLIAPRLWSQSEKCAIANRILAQQQRIDPFEAFLAGLLQHVGLIVSLRVIDQMWDGKQAIGSETFCNALINHGRTLSCSIGKEWRFPDSVSKAIAEQGNNSKNADISAMGKLLAIGDYLGKLSTLAKHERLDSSLAVASKSMSEQELACLEELNQLPETEY